MTMTKPSRGRNVFVKSALRTDKTQQRYKDGAKSSFSRIPSKEEWKYWRLVTNEFPYDVIASEHDLLIPKRVVSDLDGLNLQEKKELDVIFKSLDKRMTYDAILLAFPWSRTVDSHLHFHLLRIIIKG